MIRRLLGSAEAPGDGLRSAAGRLGLYAVATCVLWPSLLVFDAVDFPDEYLEFNSATLAFWGEQLSSGQLRAWNPFKLGGMSAFADPLCLSPVYPLAALLPVLPLNAFVLLAWVLHLAIGAAGVDRLSHSLGAGRVGAASAGVAWLGSTLAAAAVVDGQMDMLSILAWLPWALVACRRALDAGAGAAPGEVLRAVLRPTAWAGLALGLLALGGHTRFAAISFGVVILFCLCSWWTEAPEDRPRASVALGIVSAACALGGLLCAPSVLPAVLEIGGARSAAPSDVAALKGQLLPAAGLAGLVYPRVLLLDERWYHLGVALVLPLLRIRHDRRVRGLLLAGGLLLLLGMGSEGPLFLLVRPIHWLIYPVETGVAALSVPILCAAIGLAVHSFVSEPPSDSPWLLLCAVGLAAAAVAVGFSAAGSIYHESVRSVGELERSSLLHGALATAGLGAALAALRFRPGRLAAGMLLAVVFLDPASYAWRAQSAIPTTPLTPASWFTPGPAVAGLEQSRVPGRMMQWPMEPIRNFEGSLDDPFVSGSHGWGHNPMADPVVSVPAEARNILRRPLRRNSGAGSGWPQVGGSAKLPPMPWSIFHQWLSRSRSREGPNLAAEPEKLARLLELLHVRWVVSQPGPLPDLPGTRRPASEESPAVLTLASPRPAALLSTGVVVADDARAAVELLLGGQVDARSSAVLLAEERGQLEARPSEEPRALPAEVLDWAPGRWRIRIPEGSAGVLSVQDRYHAGWRARDGEGRSLHTLRANLVQLGVELPQGVSEVQLDFVAPGARAGLLLGLLGLLSAGGMLRRGGSLASSEASGDSPPSPGELEGNERLDDTARERGTDRVSTRL